jgi:hypothetical protein
MLSKGAREILIKAADIIDTKGWTQGMHARDLEGNAVSYFSESATCFCISGALRLVTKEDARYIEACWALRDLLDTNPVLFNDQPGRTKEEVIQVLLEVAHAK